MRIGGHHLVAGLCPATHCLAGSACRAPNWCSLDGRNVEAEPPRQCVPGLEPRNEDNVLVVAGFVRINWLQGANWLQGSALQPTVLQALPAQLKFALSRRSLPGSAFLGWSPGTSPEPAQASRRNGSPT